ncbi:MAG: helix-turn-helix domain-containing protein [Halobacteriales archaeon]|nr:helix-turn-helix domain-containing protein [Halobacteriales archaeon]
MSIQKKVRSREEWKGTVPNRNRSTSVLLSMAELLGKKWYPPLLYTLLNDEPRGFNELKESLDGISNKMLSKSLEELEEEHELVRREIVSEKPFRVEYSLTDRGRSLEPVVTAMQEWGQSHLD